MTTRPKASKSAIWGVCLALAVTLGAAPGSALPQAETGTYLELDIESPGQTMHVKMSLVEGRFRLDAGEEFSLVSLADKMLIIQHAERSFLEFDPAMMAGLMGGGRMPPEVRDAQRDAENLTPPKFTRTGNTKNVGVWSAYEVVVEHPEQREDLTMWFSLDVDAEFRDVAEAVVGAMSPILNNPMLGQMAGGGAGGGIFNSMERQLAAMDIPDGFPVQIISSDGGQPNTTTLRAIEPGRTFAPETWEADESYEKMQFPFRR